MWWCWERPTPSRLASSRVDARGVSDYAARWAVRLPHPMNLDDFDLAFQPKLDARKVGDEATLAFVEAKANVALLGAPGRVAHDATMPGATHQHRAHPAHTPAPCASLSPAVPLPCPWFSAAKPPGQRLPAGAPGQQAKGRGHADGQQRGDPGQRRCGYGGEHSETAEEHTPPDLADLACRRRGHPPLLFAHSSPLSICP
jgi:IstB-like ATP binding protein